ncbi:MAG: carbohydrate ABC transporter permease, partial [Bacillota bacterium]|nr:carbohydrate ABC transporter permease [Bacillota bacterium]
GRNIFAFFIFFTMLFSGGLIPSYIMWTQAFGIKNTIAALIIPNLLMNAFNVIMMRTYFTTNIPEAVIEAARIDGAGEFRILVKIVLPMSVPILTTLTLFIGLAYWNDWLNGLYYINNKDLYSIQVLLNKMLLDSLFMMRGLSSKLHVDMVINMPSNGIKMAVAIMGVIPIMLVYPFLQKYFIKGIVIGAVKG